MVIDRLVCFPTDGLRYRKGRWVLIHQDCNNRLTIPYVYHNYQSLGVPQQLDNDPVRNSRSFYHTQGILYPHLHQLVLYSSWPLDHCFYANHLGAL